jgi:hypothetical protein
MAAPQALAGPPRDGVLVALNCADGTSGPECRHAAPERKPATPAPPRNSETQRPVPHQAPDRVPPNAAQVPPQRTIHPGQQQTPQQAPHRHNNRRSRIVTRHRKSGNRSISGADSRRPTLAINRVSRSARSSRVRPRRRRPGFRQRGGRSIRRPCLRQRPNPASVRRPSRARLQQPCPARPAVRQGAIRCRPCIRGVPQRACHPPALARRSHRASPLAIFRTAVRRNKPVSQAGPDRPLADRYRWRRRSRLR